MRLLENAIIFATKAHSGANRKGKQTPYILHPLETLTIVASLTDDEEVQAAAVLHDTVEDTDITRGEIEEKFGNRVAELVASESENKREDLPSEDTWIIRKQEMIDHLRNASRETKLICLGDKLSNIREMKRDYLSIGDALWDRFNQKDRNMHRWYYLSICDILQREFGDVPPIIEYRMLIEQVFGSDSSSVINPRIGG